MRKNDTNLRREHEAIRNEVGFYDFTHQLLEVRGKDAGSFLDKMFVNSIEKTKEGKAVYTTMLNEDGIIIDDVIVFHVKKGVYWISTLYINELIEWFDNYKADNRVRYKDITSENTMFAVQGPNSKRVLNDILKKKVDAMSFFSIKDNMIGDIPVKVARAGYTGELGYEIYCDPKFNDLVIKELLEKGEPYGIEQIETDVILNSIPREKGFVLMSDLEGTNPLEVDFDWTVDWSTDFIGKDKLEKVKSQGPKHNLLGFTVEDDAAEIKAGDMVSINGEDIGKVTLFTYGYTVEKNIGFALVETSKAKVGDTVKINDIDASLTERVFYDVDGDRVMGTRIA